MMSDVYGYYRSEDKRPILNHEQAKVVKIIFDRFVNYGYSVWEIKRYLEEEKIPNPTTDLNKKNKKRNSKSSAFKRNDHTIRQIL